MGDEEMVTPSTTPLYQRLHDAAVHSWEALGPFRKNRVEAVREYVGFHHGDGGTDYRLPINMMELATTIFMNFLISNTPRVLLTTALPQYKKRLAKFEAAINRIFIVNNLEQTLQDVAFDSLYGLGVIKIGTTEGAPVQYQGETVTPNVLFVDRVDMDDWVHDTLARDWRECRFFGNRYRLPYEQVMESKAFRNKGNLRPTEHVVPDELGFAEQSEKVASIGFEEGHLFSGNELEPYVDLWDYWVPSENTVFTMATGGGKPLREVEWDGPEQGPYRFLAYNRVPNSTMPLAPIASWLDLHDLINSLMNKCAEQARRQKTVLGYQGSATADAQRVVDSDDGDSFMMNNPNAVREFRFGGADAANMALIIQAQNIFSRNAGNLDTLGGLSAQADTLGQEQLLSASANRRAAQMQKRMMSFTQDVARDVAWHLWNDPLAHVPVTMPIEGTQRSYPDVFTRYDRLGDFLDHEITIEPYSMQYLAPEQRLAAITQVFQTFILPMLPMLQQQGMVLDLQSLLKLVAKYRNMNEMNDFIRFMEAPNPDGTTHGDRPLQSPVTNRINTRVNRPGGTRTGQDAAMAQTLLGGNMQDAERASIVRP